MSESTSSTTNASTTTSTRDDGRSTTSSTSTSGSGSQSRSTSSDSSKSSSSGGKSGGKGKRIYDQAGDDPKPPNSKADPLGPITRIKDGDGNETPVYPGMTIGYSSGAENTYDEGSYANDAVNSYYEDRAKNGVRLPS